MASNSNDTINPDDMIISFDTINPDVIISFDTMNQVFELAKLFGTYYNEYKQQHQQSKHITKTKVTTCSRLPTIPE